MDSWHRNDTFILLIKLRYKRYKVRIVLSVLSDKYYQLMRRISNLSSILVIFCFDLSNWRFFSILYGLLFGPQRVSPPLLPKSFSNIFFVSNNSVFPPFLFLYILHFKFFFFHPRIIFFKRNAYRISRLDSLRWSLVC